MLRTRVIPCLLIQNGSLVKTIRFKNARYVGDPVNTARIFNELEVDELIVLDIRATLEKRCPDYNLLRQLAEECFMPLSYGGALTSLEEIQTVFSLGFEKVALNTAAVERPEIISKAADRFGSQSIIGSIDVRRNLFGNYYVATASGTRRTDKDPAQWAVELQTLGVGEILLTSIDKEGTWSGYDLELTRRVTSAITVPLIAHGGAGVIADIGRVTREAGAAAAALGSMVVFQGRDRGVLVNFPDRRKLESAIH
jgi:cyclase